MAVVGPGPGRTRDAAGAHYLIKTLLVVITKLFNIVPCGYMTAAVHHHPLTPHTPAGRNSVRNEWLLSGGWKDRGKLPPPEES